jgi:hypothetical protein
MSDLLITRGANISACGLYRTTLTRIWDHTRPILPFWLLNPSKADAFIDDPTARSGMGFAHREGKGGMLYENAYSFRATDPKELATANDPFGPDNYAALLKSAVDAAASNTPIVCGWGAHKLDEDVYGWMAEIVEKTGVATVCLGVTKHGFPRHPLYVRADQPLVPFDFNKLAVAA